MYISFWNTKLSAYLLLYLWKIFNIRFYHPKKKRKKEIYLLLHSNWHFHPCLTANSQVVTIIEDIKFRSSTQVDFAIQILRGPTKTSNWVWWNYWTRFLTWNATPEGAFISKATSKIDLTSANPILSDHLQVGGSSKASNHKSLVGLWDVANAQNQGCQ